MDELAKMPMDDEIWYLYSTFCRINLPRNKIVASDYCYRHSKWSIFISSSILQENNIPVRQNIIYGTKARLLLIAINTYAIVNRTSEIILSHSFNQLLSKLKLAPRGGKNSPAQYLKQQLKSLITCNITVCTEKTYLDINPVSGFYGVDAYSTASLPPIPRESCHPFHGKAASDSAPKLPL